MDATSPRARRLPLVLLLAIAGAIVWAALTLLVQATASYAADDDGDGLLGAATSTANTVGQVVGTVEDTANAVVTTAAKTVVEPVAKVAPAPVAQPAAHVAKATAHVATAATKHVEKAVTTTAQKTLDAVGTVAAATPLAPVVGTSGTLTPILGGADPVGGAVGAVAGALPASTALAPSTAVTAVPDSPASAAVAAPAAFTPLAAFLAAGRVVVVSIAATGSAALANPWGGLSAQPDASAPPGGGLTLTLGLLAAMAAVGPRLRLASRPLSPPRDDALPGAPVYETDTSPD